MFVITENNLDSILNKKLPTKVTFSKALEMEIHKVSALLISKS